MTSDIFYWPWTQQIRLVNRFSCQEQNKLSKYWAAAVHQSGIYLDVYVLLCIVDWSVIPFLFFFYLSIIIISVLQLINLLLPNCLHPWPIWVKMARDTSMYNSKLQLELRIFQERIYQDCDGFFSDLNVPVKGICQVHFCKYIKHEQNYTLTESIYLLVRLKIHTHSK